MKNLKGHVRVLMFTRRPVRNTKGFYTRGMTKTAFKKRLFWLSCGKWIRGRLKYLWRSFKKLLQQSRCKMIIAQTRRLAKSEARSKRWFKVKTRFFKVKNSFKHKMWDFHIICLLMYLTISVMVQIETKVWVIVQIMLIRSKLSDKRI